MLSSLTLIIGIIWRDTRVKHSSFEVEGKLPLPTNGLFKKVLPLRDETVRMWSWPGALEIHLVMAGTREPVDRST